MNLVAIGHRVIVKPQEVKKKHGDIILAVDENAERFATTTGEVVAVGPDAWKTMYINGYEAKPWATVGQLVHYAKYVGFEIKDDETGQYYRVLNDEDIVAVISKREKY